MPVTPDLSGADERRHEGLASLGLPRVLALHAVVVTISVGAIATISTVMSVPGAPLATWWTGLDLSIIALALVALTPASVLVIEVLAKFAVISTRAALLTLVACGLTWGLAGVILAAATRVDGSMGLTAWMAGVGVLYGFGALYLLRLDMARTRQ